MKDQYVIMDARARFDIDEAQVLEACGATCPTKKYLKKNWDCDAIVVKLTKWDGKAFTDSEVVDA